MPIRIIYTEELYRAAHRLQKRFPHILDDVEVLSDQLEKGEIPGDRIMGLPYRVFKARLRNTDARRGKSGGYRVIYYLETEEQTVLLTIYSKSDQSDIPTHVIRRIIEGYKAGGR
jgi:mRNA-degrading endonuclease RelE of RelBE toxin-antitoxin system